MHPAEYGRWAGAFDSGQLLEMRAALAATMPARLRGGGAAVIVADRFSLELAALPHTEHGRRVDSLVVERACFSANSFTCNVHSLKKLAALPHTGHGRQVYSLVVRRASSS